MPAPVEADALLNVNLSYFDIPAAGSVNTEAVVCVKRPGVVPENQVAEQDFLDQRLRIDVGVALMDAAHMMRGGNFAGARAAIRGQHRFCAMAPSSEYTTFAMKELSEAEQLCGHDAVPAHANKLYFDCQSHTNQRSKATFRSSMQTSMVERAVRGIARPLNHPDGQQQLEPPQEQQTEESAHVARRFRLFPGFRTSSKKKSDSEDKDATKE